MKKGSASNLQAPDKERDDAPAYIAMVSLDRKSALGPRLDLLRESQQRVLPATSPFPRCIPPQKVVNPSRPRSTFVSTLRSAVQTTEPQQSIRRRI
jgi:hypothetical protein